MSRFARSRPAAGSENGLGGVAHQPGRVACLRARPALEQAGAELAVNGLFAAQLAVAGELLDILRAPESDLPATTELLSSLPVTSPVLARSLPRILQHDIAPKFPLDLVAKDLDYLIQQAGDQGTPVLDAVLHRVRARAATDDIVALATA
jgi:3-hydroxyisobutyrate dehydrogenase-like beta-hydroxyacid dehydrogenase